MAVVISIDAGTTGVRALAVDEAGKIVAWSHPEFPQSGYRWFCGRLIRSPTDVSSTSGHADPVPGVARNLHI